MRWIAAGGDGPSAMDESQRKHERDDPPHDPKAKRPANSAPDAVKDPNEKTDGHPGLPADSKDGDDADPGGG